MNITNLTAVAMKRAIKAYDDIKVQSGQYHIDEIIRVVGMLKVGEPHDAKVANTIPWQQLCCLLLGKLNAATSQSVTDEVIESFLRGSLKDDLATQIEVLKPRVQACLDRILGTTTREVSGAVTGNVVLMPVVVDGTRAEQKITHITEGRGVWDGAFLEDKSTQEATGIEVREVQV